MTLYEHYHKILNNPEEWIYYHDYSEESSHNTPDFCKVLKYYEAVKFDYLLQCKNAYYFIEDYFKAGGKVNLLRNNIL